MIDREEYDNVIQAVYEICQQIHDMELSGAIIYEIYKGTHEEYGTYTDIRGISILDEFGEEFELLQALLSAKNLFPQTFLKGCKATPIIKFEQATAWSRTEYPGNFISDCPV